MTQIIRARHVLTGQGWCHDRLLRIDDGMITAIEPVPIGTPFREAELLCPAYIDLHVHGGDGVDVMDCDPDALDRLAIFKAQQGVGAWLPTTVTAPMAEIHHALARIAKRCQSGGPGATVLGSYLEGPFFTPKNRGAHPAALFQELDLNELDRLITVSQQTLRIVALAPEKPGALEAITYLKQRGVLVMLDHSDATWEQTQKAFDSGADGLVHCFNGMTGLHHREPGMVGAGLTDDHAWLELIADGHHVHPSVLALSCTCARQRIILITDAMRAASMPDGRYEICGCAVDMKQGVVRTEEGGLAGSTLSLDAAVRNMVQFCDISSEEAIKMASLHPAKLLGMDSELGTIDVGKRANLIALDSHLQVQKTWVNGIVAI